MKLSKIILVLTLVMGLLLGGALPVLADTGVASTQPSLLLQPDWGKGRWALGKVMVIRGEVTSVGTDEIEVDGETIFVDETTKIRVPTLGKLASLEDIEPGMHIVALVYEAEGETLYARHIVVVPGRPQYRHHVGEVLEYTAESIRIQPRKGDSVEFQIIGELKVLPPGATVEVGNRVTVISCRDPISDRLIARGVVVHPAKPWLGLEYVSGTITVDETEELITVDSTELNYDGSTIFILRGILAVETGQEAIILYREQEDDTLLAKLALVGIDLPGLRAALGKGGP